MAGRIVVFGATGYTGDLVARELVERGARPVLAARSADRLASLAGELGGLETQVADVSRPETVRALLEPGDVLVSTVGPFVRWGDPAVEAAIGAGARYFDSTGEPAFIRRVFERFGPRAADAGAALMTAFGFDWVPGNLAGALALRDAGEDAVRVEVGYFPRGGGSSGGTQASAIGAMVEGSFAFRGGRLRGERAGARARAFTVAPGRERWAVSAGGSEHFALPATHPALRDVDVLLGMMGAGASRSMPLVTAVLGAGTALPPLRAGLNALLGRVVKGSTGGPSAEARASSSATVVAEAFSAAGDRLARTVLEGVNAYTFTAGILAWAAMTAAADGVAGTGALGPVQAFGLDRLQAGVASAGLRVAG